MTEKGGEEKRKRKRRRETFWDYKQIDKWRKTIPIVERKPYVHIAFRDEMRDFNYYLNQTHIFSSTKILIRKHAMSLHDVLNRKKVRLQKTKRERER